MTRSKNFILCILDGWGYNPSHSPYNAWHLANTPNFDKIFSTYPYTTLGASGAKVGLPSDQMGNSEVGHLTIGSGRIIMQDLPRINKAIADGSFKHNNMLKVAMEEAKNGGKAIHLIGLFSPGGVHSHIDHINYLCSLLEEGGIRFYIHAITDGRDVEPQSSLLYLAKSLYQDNFATVIGRYYAMDRNKCWERTELAAQAIMNGIGSNEPFLKPTDVIEASYAQNRHDEFILPTTHKDYHGIAPGDLIITLNFRADRMKQLIEILLARIPEPKVISMTDYGPSSTRNILLPQNTIINTLGEILANNNKTQLRLAETEKYAHVTFFFNGGRHRPYGHEDRLLIPSPNVATYDLCPEMSAYELCDALCDAIKGGRYDFICVNFANADMVGHTGNIPAAIKACEVLDECMGRILKVTRDQKAELFITADHGNIEEMFDGSSNQPHTFHTCNPVPFIYVGEHKHILQSDGGLGDVAPTILAKMGLLKPTEMTGKNLFS